jgi:transposase
LQDTALFSQLLCLSSPWQVVSVTPDLDSKALTIRIEWPKGEKGPCPDCGAACPVYDHREEREWRHLDTMQFKTLLVCPVPRVNCSEHGVKSLKTPWADVKSRFTMLFERFAIDVLLTAKNQEKARELMDLSWDEVHRIQERAVARGMQRRVSDETPLRHAGIDEKSFLKGHSYASLLYDIDRPRVLEVVPERTQEAAEELLRKLPEKEQQQVEAVAVDMWKPYLAAIANVLPEADIVHDKYHIVSHLNKAVDDVRRKEHKELKRDGNESLKGTRYTWLRNPKNWTDEDRATFQQLKSEGLKIGRAWAMKETFPKLWDYIYEGAARTFFKAWYFWATHSRLAPMIKVARMIKTHLDNILTFLHHGITNAAAEGLNSKIQTIKADARGFRNFANYRVAILFHCGGLKLYP